MQVSARRLALTPPSTILRQTLRSHLQNLLSVHLNRGHVIARDLAILGSIGLRVLEDILVDKRLVRKGSSKLPVNERTK